MHASFKPESQRSCMSGHIFRRRFAFGAFWTGSLNTSDYHLVTVPSWQPGSFTPLPKLIHVNLTTLTWTPCDLNKSYVTSATLMCHHRVNNWRGLKCRRNPVQFKIDYQNEQDHSTQTWVMPTFEHFSNFPIQRAKQQSAPSLEKTIVTVYPQRKYISRM